MYTTFYLNRIEDASGVSGTGRVAEGIIFSNGRCAMCWLTDTSSVSLYDQVDDIMQIHGHEGKTQLVIEIPGDSMPLVMEHKDGVFHVSSPIAKCEAQGKMALQALNNFLKAWKKETSEKKQDF